MPVPVGMGGGGGPQVNKFEQISSDHHQMSVAGGSSIDLVSGIMGNGHMWTSPSPEQNYK